MDKTAQFLSDKCYGEFSIKYVEAEMWRYCNLTSLTSTGVGMQGAGVGTAHVARNPLSQCENTIQNVYILPRTNLFMKCKTDRLKVQNIFINKKF